MRSLTSTLLEAQRRDTDVFMKLTFSKAGESDVVIEEDRVLRISGDVSADSQKVDVIFDNSDAHFNSLDLRGWTVVVERGLRTTSTIEYDAMPPMKVISQYYVSSDQPALYCVMLFIGIPDRLKLDKASKDYYNHWSNTKTVKSLITEIASGVAVDTELTEEQTTNDTTLNLYGASAQTVVGVALTITNRTVTKLAFKLAKFGSPGGDVTFKITEATLDEETGKVTVGSVLASKTVATSAISGTAAFVEATLTTPLLVNQRVWLTCDYNGGDASNYVTIKTNSEQVKPFEALVSDGLDEAAASPDETWEDGGQGGVYRYKYTGGSGTTNGVDCFTVLTAYTVTYDSEDSLIDVYVPADGFTISEGSSRLDTINTLLQFTGCVMRDESDGNLHVFVPTTTGEVYDYQYELEDNVAIDGGSAAIDRASTLPALSTYIDLENPFDFSGVVTKLAILAASNMTGMRVGSFYLISGTTYKCRDSVAIGAVTAGSEQDFSTELTVVAGDFPGCYFATGTIEAATSGGSGVMSIASEQIDPDDSASYSLSSGYAMSLYGLRATEHEFFAKAVRSALVLPNAITVHSFPEDDDQYTGSANSTASYALYPNPNSVKAHLASNAQAASIAAAMIAMLEMKAQGGSATVPVNLGAEVYDYCKVTDARQSDSRTGNLGYIKWWWKKPRTDREKEEFHMTFSFGEFKRAAIRGPHFPPVSKIPPITLEEFTAEQWGTNDSFYDRFDVIEPVVERLDARAKTEDELNNTIDTSLIRYLKHLHQDKTPQLGGDLDLDGKNIDFATTKNISDCLDEDNMASNSATKLATQQSIKAYVDSKIVKIKAKQYTRVMTAASGDVAYTGIGFQPKGLIVFATGGTFKYCWGMSDSTTVGGSFNQYQTMLAFVPGDWASFIGDSGAPFIVIKETDANYQYAYVTSMDADGFTLTWTKAGSPTDTILLHVMAFS